MRNSGTSNNDIEESNIFVNRGNNNSNRQAKWEETILFFLSAVGCTLGWTAVLSNLVYYTDTLGVDSYVILNLCIYAPLFPITIAQSLWDADFDRRYSSITSFWVRGSVGFGVTLLSTIILALGSKKDTLLTVSLLSLSLGTSSGILHGALKQMASFVYPGCGRLAAAVTAGLQASAVFVLFVTIFTPGSTTTSNHWLHCFYGTISVLVGLCWLGFQRLMTHSRDVYRSMLRRDSSIQLSALDDSSSDEEEEEEEEQEQDEQQAFTSYYQADDLLSPNSSTPPPLAVTEPRTSHETEDTLCTTNDDDDDDNPQHFWMLSPTMKQLILQSWPLCVAIFLTVASSMAVASWFNRVPSTSKHHPDMLPQFLFYTRLFADLMARPATLWLPTNNNPDIGTTVGDRRTLWYLLAFVVVRLLFLPYFFLYTTSTRFPRSDIAMTLGVFAFAFSSGFITTWVYQLAPRYCNVDTVTTPTTQEYLLQGHEQQQGQQQQPQQRQQQAEANAVVLLQQTNLLNVCFSASVLLGLMGSLGLSSMNMSDGGTSTS